ncbi:AAA family ATPase [Galactobacter caseinivorans]|uniref:ATP-binding cassette domain-containing protein n=1 Tax=Galactobacter caseinivorans TaxID=2676123 RepID=A0A496PJP4_9MICC|nr:AAA family ATPase [Galactobacter caseinivorans]RKW70723.1 ATP-binding cassette domain-containing protein [Galactobacter caseinivorans]
MRAEQPPVAEIGLYADAEIDWDAWPATLPAVGQLLRGELQLGPGVTFLVGENGSGKSTLLEGIALAFGFSPEGGSANANHSTRPSESPIHQWLKLRRGIGAPRWGFFLRAETMHSFYTYLEDLGGSASDPDFHALSHGESFLAILETRFNGAGFFCLDEPEAALSFQSTLALMATLQSLAEEGSQILCATHSPVLAALPGAKIIEVGPWGLRESSWEDLELVQHWRRYMDRPQAYLRHLLDDAG